MIEPVPFAIDPGHPSRPEDRGCRVGNGWECDYTIALSRELLSLVRASGEPFDPFLLREKNDEVVSLDERVKLAIAGKAAFVLSIHVDSNVNSAHHGSKVLINEGDDLANSLGVALLSAIPGPYRHWHTCHVADSKFWPDAEHLLRRYRGYVPTVLWETFYASNTIDLEAAFSPSTIAGFKACIMVMLARYRQLNEKISGGFDAGPTHTSTP